MNRPKLLRFLLLLLVIRLPALAEKIASMPAPTGYVDDYAGVLSSDGNADIDRICTEVHDKTRAQIFLVTIKTTEDESIETFANRLFHNWKIGEKKTDRGVLLLFAINDHKRWIEVGYGLEGILNDAKVGDIGRDMVPNLKAARYDAAMRTGVMEVAQIIATDSKVALDESIAADVPNSQPLNIGVPSSSIQATSNRWILLLFIPLFLGPFILIIWLALRARRNGATFGSTSIGSDFTSSDSFSSSDSSSSSDSFSGGDGGDSGGGGAGGSW